MKMERTIRKMIIWLLAAVMLVGMAGCGGEQAQKDGPALDACAARLLEAVPEPSYGSVGGEWAAFGLARWGGEVPQAWFDSYYASVEAYVKECGGVLDSRKYTEYSRVILALTAIGKDPGDVGGYDLLAPLADYEQTVFQGIMGPVYALLALDSGSYEIPQNTGAAIQATREMYVDCILDMECPGGGWTIAGSEADVDVTAMTLQALAKYRERQDVADAVERGVSVLSRKQNEQGGYAGMYSETETSESICQVIVALAELGIGIDDSRFVKNGCTLKDRLLDFMTEDCGFGHLLGEDMNLMATEQAFYALVALERAEQGEASLYDMSDVN